MTAVSAADMATAADTAAARSGVSEQRRLIQERISFFYALPDAPQMKIRDRS